MKKTFVFFLLILIGLSCQNKETKIEREPWIEQPVSKWPKFALTNTIEFTDTSYYDLANSFLISTGYDTLLATCKHFFLVFKNSGLKSIDLGDNFKSWQAYPKGNKDIRIEIKNLINKNSNEEIGEFNTLKDRDWIIFNIKNKNKKLYPLKIRYTPVRENEIVYAVGWSMNQNIKSPAIIKMQAIKNLGNYYYINTITENVDPYARSGSAVIDKNGYLVGLVSGAEGKFGVIASVKYLQSQFNIYKIEYK